MQSDVITLDPNGSEQIDCATTLAINPGESIFIYGNGAAFYSAGLGPYASDTETAAGASAVKAVTPAGLFSTLGNALSNAGYQKFPNGLILQWERALTDGSGFALVTLNMTFPNAIFVVVCTPITSSGADRVDAYSYTTSNFSLQANTVMQVPWVALGN